MASLRQHRVATEIIKNAKRHKPLSGGEILRRAGYSESIAATPTVVLKSKGVKEELEDLGFTVDGADMVVKKILYRGKKEETQLKAAQEVYKRHGAYKHEEGNKTLVLMVSAESAQRFNVTPNAPTPLPEKSSTGPA